MIIPMESNYLVTVRNQTYELSPGDIFLIPGGELHSLRAVSRGGRFIFLFELDQIWKVKGTSFLNSCVSQPLLINRSTCPSIYDEESAIIAQICLDYLQEDSLRDITIYARLLTFLINYGRFRMSQDGGIAMSQLGHSSQRNYTEKFNAVFDYLDRHFAEDLTLEDVAAVAGFSKFHFSRTFKQLSGENFYDYLCHRRIKSSEMLLMKPGLSISQIALQSGFSSVSTLLFFSHPIKSLLSGLVQLVYYGIILIWFPLTSVIFFAASVWLPMLMSFVILYPVLDKHFGLTAAYEKIQQDQWGTNE